MGFWTLQDNDIHKPVYLLPQLFRFSRSKTRWANILSFKRRTHLLMLTTTIAFGMLVAFSGLTVAGIAVSIAMHPHAPHHIATTGMYSLLGIFLLYGAVRITQSCVLLARFLLQTTKTEPS